MEDSHFLFTDWALAAPTVNPPREYSSLDGTGIHDQKTSRAPDLRQNLCQNAQKDDNAQLRDWSRVHYWAEQSDA